MKKLLFFIFFFFIISCAIHSQNLLLDSGKALNKDYFLKNNNTIYHSSIDSSTWTFKKSWKTYRLPIIFLALSGIVDGFHEAATHHYNSFKKKFPSINDHWWNPEISWTNKYKNYDKNQGEQFLFSTNALVMVTDWYHLSRSIESGLNISAICTSIPISIRNSHSKSYNTKKSLLLKKNQNDYVSFGVEGKKWWIYGLEFLTLSTIKRICFELTYSQL